jgi:type IV secretory pathway VirJ component
MVFRLSAEESIDTFGHFGLIHIYRESEFPTHMVLFISGDGGWNKEVMDVASSLAGRDAFVVGVDIVYYLDRLQKTEGKCFYPAADFEMLSKFVQKKHGFTSYHSPLLVGYSSGATMAYALIAQAPQGTFKAALTFGFCPDLPLNKPLCKGSGLQCTSGHGRKGVVFLPRNDLSVPWITFQGTGDKVCRPKVVDEFVKSCENAQCIVLQKVAHSFASKINWVPQFIGTFDSLAKALPGPSNKNESAMDTLNLPLVEVPAARNERSVFAVLISGDGGWAGIDKAVALALTKKGISVVGWNSLQYFWKEKTPETASNDLDRIIKHYKTAWKKDTVICIGYSFGADVLPFMVSRLPQAESGTIPLLAFLSVSKTADFQFHLGDWIGGGPSKTSMPVIPELEKMRGKRMFFFFGKEEKEEIAGISTAHLGTTISLPGGHHFGGHYEAIADSIISELDK